MIPMNKLILKLSFSTRWEKFKKIIVDKLDTRLYNYLVTRLKEKNMEKRNLNISFYKAGGTLSTRMNLPIPWVKKLGITPEEKAVEVVFDEKKETITISKKK